MVKRALEPAHLEYLLADSRRRVIPISRRAEYASTQRKGPISLQWLRTARHSPSWPGVSGPTAGPLAPDTPARESTSECSRRHSVGTGREVPAVPAHDVTDDVSHLPQGRKQPAHAVPPVAR